MKWFLREASLATSAAALVVAIQPSWLPAMVRIWVIAVLLLVIGVCFAWLSRIPVERLERVPATAKERGQLREMRDIERANDFLVAVDYQLFPFLKEAVWEIAQQRLLTRRDVALEQEPRRARQILGEDVWALLSPRLEHSYAWSTVNHEQLSSIVAALENI